MLIPPIPSSTTADPPSSHVRRYVHASRFIDHEAAPVLGPHRTAILRAVLDATYGEGRESTCLSLRDAARRCRLSRESAQRSIMELIRAGYLRAAHKNGAARSLSIRLSDTSTTADLMPLRRRLKPDRCLTDNGSRLEGHSDRCLSDNGGSAGNNAFVEKSPNEPRKLRLKKGKEGDDLDLIYNKKEQNRDQKLQPSSALSRSPARALAEVEQRVREASTSRIAKKEASGSIGKRARWAWVRVCSNTHQADCLLKKDVVILHQYAKRTADRLDVVPLLEWCLGNWTQIIAERFAWMKTSPPPDLPSVKFFVSQAEKFEQAFRERKQLEALAGMTERERLVAKARRKGLTEEAAERQADDLLGITSERRKLEEERKALALERRKLAFTPAAAPLPQRPPHLRPSTVPSEFGSFED